MAENVIYFSGTRAELRQVIAMVPRLLSGEVADTTGLLRGLQLRMGVQALSLVKQSFIAKSRGGTDEAGDSWPKLSPKTIAYSRRHPGLAGKRAAAKAEGRPGRPLLSKKENERWKAMYTRALWGLVANPLQGPGREEKAHAAAYAWTVLKAEGGKTILGEYGDTETEILRSSGVLFNSISPGVDGPSGHPNQVFRTDGGSVIVGTNRVGAARHHFGIGVPQRRLWPDPSRWPASWFGAILGQLRDGAVNVLMALLRS